MVKHNNLEEEEFVWLMVQRGESVMMLRHGSKQQAWQLETARIENGGGFELWSHPQWHTSSMEATPLNLAQTATNWGPSIQRLWETFSFKSQLLLITGELPLVQERDALIHNANDKISQEARSLWMCERATRLFCLFWDRLASNFPYSWGLPWTSDSPEC